MQEVDQAFTIIRDMLKDKEEELKSSIQHHTQVWLRSYLCNDNLKLAITEISHTGLHQSQSHIPVQKVLLWFFFPIRHSFKLRVMYEDIESIIQKSIFISHGKKRKIYFTFLNI